MRLISDEEVTPSPDALLCRPDTYVFPLIISTSLIPGNAFIDENVIFWLK
jgi:hypothetical protein